MQGRFGVSMARHGHDRYLATSIVTQGPLQTLSGGELRLDEVPMTIYPRSARPRARAWVRFGPAPAYVACRIARTTRDAAGIVFAIDGTEYQCWVWGNAVRLVDDAQDGVAGDSPVG